MRRWSAYALLAAALFVPLGSGSATADTWPTPADLPPGTWYGEAPTGEYGIEQHDWFDWEPQIDAVTALPGARLVVKYARASRPDGSTGPAWFWFNTRAGSTFSLTGCPEAWPVHAAPVTRKRLLTAVRPGPERGFRISYDAGRNAGIFEVGAVELGPGSRLPGCRKATVLTDALPRPAWLPLNEYDGSPLWIEGGFYHGRADENQSARLQVHEGEWLVASWRDDYYSRWMYQWYSTRGPSTYLLNFCDVDGTRYFAQATREAFLERVLTRSTEDISIHYDRWRDVGRFQAASWFQTEPCEVRPRSGGSV